MIFVIQKLSTHSTVIQMFNWLPSITNVSWSIWTNYCSHMNNHKWWHGHSPLYWCFENNAVTCQHPDFISAFDIRGQYIYVNRIVMSAAFVLTWYLDQHGTLNLPRIFFWKVILNTLHFILPHFPVTFCVRKEIKTGYSRLVTLSAKLYTCETDSLHFQKLHNKKQSLWSSDDDFLFTVTGDYTSLVYCFAMVHNALSYAAG